MSEEIRKEEEKTTSQIEEIEKEMKEEETDDIFEQIEKQNQKKERSLAEIYADANAIIVPIIDTDNAINTELNIYLPIFPLNTYSKCVNERVLFNIKSSKNA